MKENIILVGFMGVGKGTISRALVKKLDVVALDTDDIVESMENRTVKKIFKKEGEPYFRALEEKISRWITASVSGTIISTGGGFIVHVSDPKAMGKVVYLKNSYEGILKRIMESPNAKNKLAKRPLLQDKKRAKKLFDERNPRYEALADIVIDVAGKSPEAVAEEIIQALA